MSAVPQFDGSSGEKIDFFVSRAGADSAWAQWIAWQLEAAGYRTVIQDWDFSPGVNIIHKMQEASARAARTIAVVSRRYFQSEFTEAEWSAALYRDVPGAQGRLLLIRIEDFPLPGMLGPRNYLDLFGMDRDNARAHLLDWIAKLKKTRGKPEQEPGFPGSAVVQPEPQFPGTGRVKWNDTVTRKTDDRKPPEPDANRRPANRLHYYAFLSLACFLLCVGFLAILLWKVETLAAFHLKDKLFYLVLIPMGLAGAGFLLGVVRSVALYRGRAFHGWLELAGPVALFAMVVLGGFVLPPPAPAPFAITVFVHGPGGLQDTILRGHGTVVMDLNGNRREEKIDDKGAAHFPGIPGDLHEREVPISIEAKGFERADSSAHKLDGESLYLAVQKSAAGISGKITDDRGEPVAEAEIDVGGLLAKTNGAGRFNLDIPGNRTRDEAVLHVQAKGFEPQSYSVVAGADEIQIRLERAKAGRRP